MPPEPKSQPLRALELAREAIRKNGVTPPKAKKDLTYIAKIVMRRVRQRGGWKGVMVTSTLSYRRRVEVLIMLTLEAIVEVLVDGYDVGIPKFGTFTTKRCVTTSHITANNHESIKDSYQRRKEPIKYERYIPYFRPSRIIKSMFGDRKPVPPEELPPHPLNILTPYMRKQR